MANVCGVIKTDSVPSTLCDNQDETVHSSNAVNQEKKEKKRNPNESNELKTYGSFRVVHHGPKTTGRLWNLFDFSPVLTFKVQRYFPPDTSPTTALNIWRPTYFGLSVPQKGRQAPKLNRNDLIITRDVPNVSTSDKAIFRGSSAAPTEYDNTSFSMENVLGGIHFDYPPSYVCQCCYGYRVHVYSSDGSRWTMIDRGLLIDEEKLNGYNFSVDGDPRRRVRWEPYRTVPHVHQFPKDLTDIRPTDVLSCRIIEMGVGSREAPILAIMSQGGIKVVHKMMVSEQNVEYGASDDQTLVLMTGIALAHHQGCLK